MNKKIVILGAGPAGMAVAYYLNKRGYHNFVVLEGSTSVGGNAKTFQHGDFLFDAGAHRWHDKSDSITEEIKKLLGDELKKINVPSQIFHHHKWIDFPLAPLDLVKKIGITKSTKALFSLLKAKRSTKSDQQHFEHHAVKAYGKDIAERFLLNYSQKLWGKPCHLLSPEISGSRLKGLDLKSFLLEGGLGRKKRNAHIDGSFYYPDFGIGSIFEKIKREIGAEKIKFNSKITRIIHQDNSITGVEINHREIIKADLFINTLPISITLQILQPTIPEILKQKIEQIEYRDVLLQVVFLNIPQLSPNASIYFPDPEITFTRIYEPKNRSKLMAPAHQTCIVIEIPCNAHQYQSIASIELVNKENTVFLINKELFSEKDILETKNIRLSYAYPVLDLQYNDKIKPLNDYISRFQNLHMAGRSANFQYTHIHNLFEQAKGIVDKV